MKYSFFAIGLSLILLSIACEKTENNDKGPLEEDAFAQKCQELSDYIGGNAQTIDYNSLTAFAREYEDYESAEVVDSVLYIHFKDDYVYLFDMFGRIAPKKTGVSLVDTLIIKHQLDSLSSVIKADSLFFDTDSPLTMTGSSLTRAGENQLVRLRKKNVLFWHNVDIPQKDVDDLLAICKQCGLKPTISSDLNDIAEFDNYDIVIFAAHGDSFGRVFFPLDYEHDLKIKGINTKVLGTAWVHRDINGNVLKDSNGEVIGEPVMGLLSNDLKRLMPHNLENTILWTCVCHAGTPQSMLKKVAFDCNVAEYYGCDGPVALEPLLYLFSFFAPKLYKFYYDSETAFGHRLNGGARIQGLGSVGEVLYKRFGQKCVFYVGSGALAPIIESNGWLITTWRGIASSVLHLLGYNYSTITPTRSGNASDGSVGTGEGLHLVNMDTNEERYIPLNSQTVKYYKPYDYGDFTRFNIAVNPGELATGQYKYASYSTDTEGNIVIDEQYVYLNVKSDEDEMREKLIQFYNDTDGPHWKKNENWCSAKPIEEWYGITKLDDKQYEISLNDNNLSGYGALVNCSWLKILELDVNPMISLDVSGCTALTKLWYPSRSLISLDASGCTALLYLDGEQHQFGDQMTSLNLSGCTSLPHLYLYTYRLTSLDVTGCTALKDLSFYDSALLTSLNVSGCTALQYLDCSYNQLTSLDVSTCTALKDLRCSNNILTSLDVSGSTAIETLNCNNNPLTSLNVSGCTALKHLGCDNTHLTSLDVSGCTALEGLGCDNTHLTSLDVSGCSALEYLDCHNNHLTSLDASGCTALKDLRCSNNILTSLNLSGCTAIKEIQGSDLKDNPPFSLNLSGCTALSRVYLGIYYGTDADLVSIELSSLDVSGCTALKSLNCYNAHLTSLDASGCTALEELECSKNQLTSLDVSGCTALKYLDCFYNQLTSLDVSGCTALEFLSCYDNLLTYLGLSESMSLFLRKNTYLDCRNNHLTRKITYENKAGVFGHDVLYYYWREWDPVMYRNKTYYGTNDYGWYYEGEPERGYH